VSSSTTRPCPRASASARSSGPLPRSRGHGPRRSVHLKLDPEVFDFFYQEAGGKGHLTRMQNVLKAYVNARQRS
jgi:uncharacterized protein (DUF4415 family)